MIEIIKRILSFTLVLCIVLAIGSLASASDLLSYDEAIERLGSISLSDKDELDLIYNSFQALGSRYFALQYLYITQALFQLAGGEDASFDRIEISLTILQRNSAFIENYTADESLADLQLDDLLAYVNARKLEAAGRLEEAYQVYIDNQILDSIDRAIAIGMQLSSESAAADDVEFPDIPTIRGSRITWQSGEQEIKAYLSDRGFDPVNENYGIFSSALTSRGEGDIFVRAELYIVFGFLDNDLALAGYELNTDAGDVYTQMAKCFGEPDSRDPRKTRLYHELLFGTELTDDSISDYAEWTNPDGTYTCLFTVDGGTQAIVCINEPLLMEQGVINGLGNATNGNYATIYEGVLYYENGNDIYNIYSSGQNGENPIKLYNISGYPNEGVCLADGYVYHDDVNRLIKTRIDGATVDVLLDDMQMTRYAGSFLVHQARIYIEGSPYDENSNAKDNLYSINTDGTGFKAIPNVTAWEIAAYGDYLFYSETFSRMLYRIDLDGQNKVLLFAGAAESLNVSKDWVYFTSYGNIMKVKHDGSDLQQVLKADVTNFNISGSHIFYLSGELDARSIRTVKLDGTADFEVRPDINTWELTIAGDWIYFYQHELQDDGAYLNIGLYKIRKDGSDLQLVKPNNDQYY